MISTPFLARKGARGMVEEALNTPLGLRSRDRPPSAEANGRVSLFEGAWNTKPNVRFEAIPVPLVLALGLLVALLTMACGSDDDAALTEPKAEATPTEPTRVVFMAGFKAQANLPFVAAYVAQDQGYFSDEGLEVDIRHASSGEHLKLLMAGDVDFTTAAAASVLKRRADPELPIVAFALFGQRDQQAFIALSSSEIRTVKDWEGKTFGYKTSQPPGYLALLKANGVDRSKITEVRVGFDPRVLTQGRIDILAAFKSNEPDTLRGLGFDVIVFDQADYGIAGMGLTYITRQDLADQDPDTVERFLRATMRAMEFIFANPDDALTIVMKFAPGENRAHQQFMLQAEMDDAVSDLTRENGLGWMTGRQWKNLYDQLLEFEALTNPFDYRTAFTDRFLKAVYDNGELR